MNRSRLSNVRPNAIVVLTFHQLCQPSRCKFNKDDVKFTFTRLTQLIQKPAVLIAFDTALSVLISKNVLLGKILRFKRMIVT